MASCSIGRLLKGCILFLLLAYPGMFMVQFKIVPPMDKVELNDWAAQWNSGPKARLFPRSGSMERRDLEQPQQLGGLGQKMNTNTKQRLGRKASIGQSDRLAHNQTALIEAATGLEDRHREHPNTTQSKMDSVSNALHTIPSSDTSTSTWTEDEHENNVLYQQCQINQPFPRPTHTCVMDKWRRIPYCHMENLRVDPSKIHMDKGGEDLETVMGRSEDKEMPQYTKGAFSTSTPVNMQSTIFRWRDKPFVVDVLDALITNTDQTCSTTVPGVTLFITRIEYVNLYHTILDWWNTFLAMPEPTHQSVNVVFLDSHAKGILDTVWSDLWGNVTFVKHLPVDTCFESAYIIPPGSRAQLWSNHRTFHDDVCSSMTNAFERFFLTGYGLENVPVEKGRITIIDRRPDVTHPRSQRNAVTAERGIHNFDYLRKELLQQTDATTVEIVQFTDLTFRDQLELIRKTHVLIGNHGAGIAFLLFLHPGTSVLEFRSGSSMLYDDLASWKPMIDRVVTSTAPPKLSKRFVHGEIIPNVQEALQKSLPVPLTLQ